MASAASSAAASPMSGAPGGIGGDPWAVQPRERQRYEEQFRSLRPVNGIVTGDQAKGFMLQSQLPPMVLGQIWSLADTDADGKMDINEFSIACKLINLKLRGFEIPKTLPQSLLSSLKSSNIPPAIPPLPTQITLKQVPPKPAPPMIASSVPLMTALPQSQPLIPGLSNQPPLIQPVVPLTQQINTSNIIPPLGAPMTSVAPLMQTQPTMPVMVQPTATSVPPSGVIPPLANMPQATGIIPPLGTHIPQTVGSVTTIAQPLTSAVPGSAPYTVPVSGTVPVVPVAPLVSSGIGTPHSRSIDRIAALDSPQPEWAVPHQTKLKFTQIFNTLDRARTGFLSGQQARNLMLQSKLPQTILAQIWALSDMDSDGRLGCDEFVLAMHLCEQATAGKPPPPVLPPELIPPTFRRASLVGVPTGSVTGQSRKTSVSSQGSITDADPASTLQMATFEDKRKENFEKGQAELERRRRTLLEAQRAEAEARERKEREEQEKRERARAEQERKRQQELQQQLQEQLEKERQLEEERKRQQEQREAARREMERQRQLEWEKQRSQELQQQRQRAQENVLRLKARNQSLTIELTSLTDQVKDLSQKICDTRVGVSNVKTTIDGMRATRDTHMQELSQLKNKLKEQNTRLIALSQEKMKLDAKNRINSQMNEQNLEQTQAAFDNKEIAIKNLKEKLADMEEQINGKMSDIENNNTQLNDLTAQLTKLVEECESLFNDYEDKKNKVLEMKGLAKTSSLDYSTTWKDDSAWDTPASDWPVDNAVPTDTTAVPAGVMKYRALYEFVARNQDEISFQPGDTILVPKEQNGEPGWLAGEIRGHTGWFPESYVEPIEGITEANEIITDSLTNADASLSGTLDDGIGTANRLEGIAEVPETISENSQPVGTVASIDDLSGDCYIACYPYQSVEQGDLSFNAGDTIIVLKKEGDWWTGKAGDNIGIFPSNYVQKTEMNGGIANAEITQMTQAVINAVESKITPQQEPQSITDAEISAINAGKQQTHDKSPDFAVLAANTQTMKTSKKPEIASVIAPYQATSPEQLTLARGQLIMIRKKSDSGWWEGELQAKGKRRQVGWFPATYVKVLESSGRSSGRNTPVSASRTDQQEVILDKVIALFPYTAQNADELTFNKDDIISVTARDEPSWWRGELNGVSGLFPSNYVGPLQSQSTLSPQEKKRQEYIWELISSEKAYIEDMSVVNEVFEQPLIESNIITPDQISKIFVNWQEILKCNYNFLNDLQNRYYENPGNVDLIGDVICKHIPCMTPYIKFCSSQLSAALLLQTLTEASPSFRELVKKCQSNPKTKGMPLSSFLIKPMQRITKYPLIINKILENTPNEHEDHLQLTEALQKAELFCKHLNEGVRERENAERLDWLQKHVQCDGIQIMFNSETNCVGSRMFLHYGPFTKVKSGKELMGFLMNDFLLLVQPTKSCQGSQFSFEQTAGQNMKMYKQPIFLNDLILTKDTKSSMENINGTVDANKILRIKTCTKTLMLLTPTVTDCNLWIKRITEAKNNFDKQYCKSLQRQKSKQPCVVSRGRLLVVAKQGAHFQRTTGKTVCENVFCKLTIGDQEQVTDATNAILSTSTSCQQNLQNSSPLSNAVFEWNASMQFHIYDLEKDVLAITVYEKCLFTPNQFLGRGEVRIWDILNETQTTNGPIKKKLILHQVESGEVLLKLDLRLFDIS